MRLYVKQYRFRFVGALVCILISTLFAVTLQFLKGYVLDCAIAENKQATIRYAALLIVFILCEVLFYFCYKRLSARFIAGCTKRLKHDIFQSILLRSYPAYKDLPQGTYLAKYTNEADEIKVRRFSMLPLLWEILFKIVFVSIALFFLDVRVALVTIVLLTTPLYLPKLLEKRLQRVQAEHLRAAEENIAKVNDWLSGFEIIKNFSIEKNIMERFDRSNDVLADRLLRDAQLGATSQLMTTLISYGGIPH